MTIDITDIQKLALAQSIDSALQGVLAIPCKFLVIVGQPPLDPEHVLFVTNFTPLETTTAILALAHKIQDFVAAQP